LFLNTEVAQTQKIKQNTASLNRTQVIALQSGLTPLDCTTVITPIDHPTTCWTYDSPTQQRKNCTAHQGKTQPADPQKPAKPSTQHAITVAQHNTTPNTVL